MALRARYALHSLQPLINYCSGHGAFVGDDNRDESDDLDEALCPVDTTRSRRNLIRDDEINSRLKKLRGRKVMIIVDACHSGTITKGVVFADRHVKVPFFGRHNSRPITKSGFERESLIEIQQNVIAYSAVAANQQALVNTLIKPHAGVFTHRFIQGIKENKADSNYDGKVTHRELLTYMRRESQAYCDRSTTCYKGLTPQLEIKSAMWDDDVHKWAKVIPRPPIWSPLESETTGPIPPPKPPIGNLRIKILPQSLNSKQDLQVEVNSSQDGYLLLFDANDSDGSLRRIFPNEYCTEKTVRIIKDRKRIIPEPYSGFKLTFPKNSGTLVALLVSKATDLPELEKALTTFELNKQVGAKDVQTISQWLSQHLNQNLRQTTKGIVSWSIATSSY